MLTIRRATIEDADDIAAREQKCFTMEGWSRDSVIDGMNYPDRVFLVALIDEAIVGHGCITSVCGEGEITNIAVDLEARGQGIASQLLEKLMRQGLDDGDVCFTLEVRESNNIAISLYKKLGFVSEGIRPHFYKNPDEGAVIMWKR